MGGGRGFPSPPGSHEAPPVSGRTVPAARRSIDATLTFPGFSGDMQGGGIFRSTGTGTAAAGGVVPRATPGGRSFGERGARCRRLIQATLCDAGLTARIQRGPSLPHHGTAGPAQATAASAPTAAGSRGAHDAPCHGDRRRPVIRRDGHAGPSARSVAGTPRRTPPPLPFAPGAGRPGARCHGVGRAAGDPPPGDPRLPYYFLRPWELRVKP